MGDAPAPDDRRASARTSTGRRVLFFSAHGDLPREGLVVNISLTGVAIVTSAPVPLETQVDLEIQPRPDRPAGEVIFVRGDVVRVSRHEGHRYLMAVHLRVAPPDHANYEPVREEIEHLLAAARGGIFGLPNQADLVAVDAFQRQEAEPPARDMGERRRRRWLLAPLLALLALFLTWWFASSREAPPDNAAATAPGTSEDDTAMVTPAIQVSRLIERATPGVPRPAGEPKADHAPGSPASESLDSTVAPEVSLAEAGIGEGATLAAGEALLDAGAWKEAAAVLEKAATDDTLAPVQRVQAYLGVAQAAVNMNAGADIQAALHAAGSGVASAGPEWQEAVTSVAEAAGGPPAALRDQFFASAVELAPTAAPFSDALMGVHLIVDKSDFVLRVMNNHEELRRFPVGLGFQGSTPEGAFVIANRIVNPTWYNRGDPVPPGDPRNPLGSRWMGLGRHGAATSYGIHGTTEPDSIGRETSLGCIRMRPHDAEALFTMCAVGTHVTIIP